MPFEISYYLLLRWFRTHFLSIKCNKYMESNVYRPTNNDAQIDTLCVHSFFYFLLFFFSREDSFTRIISAPYLYRFFCITSKKLRIRSHFTLQTRTRLNRFREHMKIIIYWIIFCVFCFVIEWKWSFEVYFMFITLTCYNAWAHAHTQARAQCE